MALLKMSTETISGQAYESPGHVRLYQDSGGFVQIRADELVTWALFLLEAHEALAALHRDPTPPRGIPYKAP